MRGLLMMLAIRTFNLQNHNLSTVFIEKHKLPTNKLTVFT